ncbi:hypothetical protein ACJMK2_042067 [Sinanodonta woodiana]|uniref:Laminin subunit alpha-1 n=1 Tax=Sinanodonta woodiana TaxID=1069815 RepID=A0ABD3W673_SINWO
MALWTPAYVLFLSFVCAFVEYGLAQVLTPPTFNLAVGKKIKATSTCGVGIGIERELFCRLTGATGDEDSRETTKEIIQEFHIAYIYIKMANSPRPGVWALENSKDNGKTYEPWQYFADHTYECEKHFQTKADQSLETDDQVICATAYSKIVPLENGEIVVSLINGRPSALNFTYADTLRSWLKATNVRLRLLRTKTLLGHLMAVARQDPSVSRRYFYSIKDISIGGRCVCNGHANSCDNLDPARPNKLICECQHNTVGDQCEFCDAANGYVQKKWQPARAAKPFVCEPCQCFGRATGCVYNEEIDKLRYSLDIHGNYEGGGVCQNCLYNSEGINCEKCIAGYYRPDGVPLNDLHMCKPCVCDLHFSTGECEDGSGRCLCRPEYTGQNCDSCSVGYYGYPNCIPCECDINGTEDEICTVGSGNCPCKLNYVGQKCDMCQFGFYDFPECRSCDCNLNASSSNNCDLETGHCPCQINYGGRDCTQCAHGYYNYSDCNLCSCDPTGTEVEICNKENGACLCLSNFNGPRCASCARGYFGYPNCLECGCKEPGSINNFCVETGQCQCKVNYAGLNCERCAPGYYRYPDCVPCNCDLYGSYGVTCDQETGLCNCRPNFEGLMCQKCLKGLYNYPICEECNCNPAGAKEVSGFPLGGCGNVIPGLLCECKERVMGRFCDICKPGYWNLNRNNLLGCDECTCSEAGTIARMNLCNMVTGQCMCKVDVNGKNCDRCRDGYYNLQNTNLYGCVGCDCDIGGSMHGVCNKETGQCVCKPRVGGRRCDQPISQHFIPSLTQLKFEIEDGKTPEGTKIRYGYDERIFPNYSWRGYAILIPYQPEVHLDIEITKPSLYRVVYHFVNRNDRPVRGEVTFTPDSFGDIKQKSEISFPPTDQPAFRTVGDSSGHHTFVLNPGRWSVSLKADNSIFLDYMVLIPQSYYEATILQQQVSRPCVSPNDQGPCVHYNYPNIGTDYPIVFGENGYIIDGDKRLPVSIFGNQNILDDLGITSMAVLDTSQRVLHLDMDVPKPGHYVMVLNYYSEGNGTQHLLFDIGDQQATAILYNCQYSSLCRQVLTGFDEMVSQFNFTGGPVHIKITGDENINAAIESIVAIPYTDWSIGYVRPSIVCIRINGKCITGRYSTPVGSVRIEFEAPPNENLKTDTRPTGILDHDAGLVRLNSTLSVIEISGSSRSQTQHRMLVHYYMPTGTGPSIRVSIFANGEEYKGVFQPQYCPNAFGCRGLIYFDDRGTDIISLKDKPVRLVFNHTSGQDIWLDYLMLIPANQYNPQDLNFQPIDNSATFIGECVDEGFQIIDPVTEFCMDNIFTLTTDFNNGALDCYCDIDGSLSFTCDNFGGQCECRPNIIGRSCSACRPGYYGFPRCKPCNCPFGLCEPLTGQCICPPRVTGERCDTCIAETYGYDQLIGCEECSCNRQGVQDSNMNCDQATGQCSCLPNIKGRRCDHCVAGFHTYPLCQECDCDHNGTIEDICDSVTAQCLCKKNVIGPRCDTCMQETFNLDPRNPAGCTMCFCMGTTSHCSSSNLNWEKHMDMVDWGITNTVDGEVREAGTTIAVLDTLSKISDTSISMYWTAPDSYLGNKVRSYGGQLRYKVIYVLPRNDSIYTESLNGPDLILFGKNMSIVYHSAAQPPPSVYFDMAVNLFEYKFYHADSNLEVTREQFMTVLVNLRALHIRASYYSFVQEIRLSEVELDIATENGTGERALSVEQCACPSSYQGTSCESCAHSHYRARNYPFLGTCVPCNCNRHSDTCNTDTGKCYNCRDNTMGDNCELCKPGYFGDPRTGGCQICGCPLPVESNNFADTCSVVAGGLVVKCDCYRGYTGDRCERCAPGHFGNPQILADTCKPCQCSGNIDPTDPDSCDFLSGACLECINNSTGPRCERCRDWWYGDAIIQKNCNPCSCDQCGSVSCDNRNGACICKPDVIGTNCDRCAPNNWGFNSCNGCLSCDCAAAAVTPQCDLQTGQCQCQPGTTGKQCESCISGYWNYGNRGCEKCHCDFDGAVTCDTETGRCKCLPGVTGDRCESCLPRWVLIPGVGCGECDNCIHVLLDDMDYLDRNITIIQRSLKMVSIGVSAMRKIDQINQTSLELRPQVDDLYESKNITLEPFEKELDNIRIFAERTLVRTESAKSNSDDLTEKILDLQTSADKVEVSADDGEKEASNAVRKVQEVLNRILEGIQVTNIERYITLAEDSLDEIKFQNFTGAKYDCDDENMQAALLLEKVKESQSDPLGQKSHVTDTNTALEDIHERLYNLQNSSVDSEADSIQAQDLVESLRLNSIRAIQDHLQQLIVNQESSTSVLSMSHTMLDNAKLAVNDSRETFLDLDTKLSKMEYAVAAVTEYTAKVSSDLDSVLPLVNDSILHASNLANQAAFLESIYTDTRDTSANAVMAASAYDNIVSAIQDAANASEKALIAAESALNKSNGVGSRSKDLITSSFDLLVEAQQNYNNTKENLRDRLKDAIDGTINVDKFNKDVRKNEQTLRTQIALLPVAEVGQRAEDVIVKGETSKSEATVSRERVQYILAALPRDIEKTKPLATDILTVNREINAAQTQVNTVKKLKPDVDSLLIELQGQAMKVKDLGERVTASISELKEKIAIARNEANLIKVGLQFLGNSSVTLRNPRSIEQAGSYSMVSLFIKTTQENGLLLYTGAETMSRQRPKDYLALELENGKVVFKFNLGDGPAKIIHPHFVSDGKWYKITAKRIGKAGNLLIERDPAAGPELEPVLGDSPGIKVVLSLNPVTSKIYAGGFPLGINNVPDSLSTVKYIGVMEDVQFDEIPLGLWNFVEGENNYVGAVQRNVLTSVASNGFRFDGAGYVILSAKDTKWVPNRKFDIIMRMKTYAENGLLFFAGRDRDFASIEIRNGKILFQFDLGGGRAQLMSPEKYNDGMWHNIQASRQNRDGILLIDDIEVYRESAPGTLNELSITDDISIGGYQKIILPVSDVTQQGFDGCIQDVTLKNRWDLNDNKQAKGVSPGCPEQIARVSTFIGDKSYVAKPQDSVGVNFDVTFKMKTKQKQNLLMFIQKSDTGTGFSVSQVDGRIVAKLNNSEEMLTLTSRINTYNDGGWHYISIMKMGRKLMMNIDDLEDMTKVADSLKDNLETDSALYFGGSDIPIAADLAATTEQFAGCVGDVTVNGRFLNFATLQKDKLASVSLAGCPIPDPTDQSATVLPTSEPDRAVTEIPKTTLAPGTCALPTDPALEGDEEQTTGWLFGLAPNSSIEFDSLPGTIRIKSRFMLEFKTTELNGVFLYVADDKHTDFISLSLINGKVRYAFNPGTGAGVVTSPKTYNDGQWHTVEFARNQKEGPLVVDGKDIGVGISKGSARSLNVRPPYYFGGVPSDLPKKGKENLDDSTDNFIGCVRNFKVDDQNAGNPPRQTSVQTCYANLEYGSFFYGNDGYIKLVDSFNVGQDLDISIEVRPRSNAGVMFSVHSNKSDFLVLELANGDVVFTVDNGAGPFSTRFTLAMDNKICDGAWHKIRAIKNKNVLQLIVDDGEPQIASSISTATAADTNDPIYIGGVPEGQTKGIESTRSFLGCIRGLYLNSKRQYLATGVSFGFVQKESCPVE